jgi:hypothetical protein
MGELRSPIGAAVLAAIFNLDIKRLVDYREAA